MFFNLHMPFSLIENEELSLLYKRDHFFFNLKSTTFFLCKYLKFYSDGVQRKAGFILSERVLLPKKNEIVHRNYTASD